MCGIAGFSGPLSPALLARMNRRQLHRGPDFQGQYYDEKNAIGLAHQRLSILDLSANGNQPMWDQTRELVLIFVGEIYNYRALKKDLEQKGHRFTSTTDTEVLLALYREHGHAMLPLLNGMFAFALFDVKKNELFLARDMFGVKPLYYTQTKEAFVFASELKTLLLEPTVAASLNPEAMVYYLQFLWSPAPVTPIKEILKLEPGHALLVSQGKIRKMWRYAELPVEEKILDWSEDEAIEECRRLFAQAVKRQMVADVQVGAFLSGGVDSSSIAYFAREHSQGKLPCFTISTSGQGKEGFADDLPYARQMAKFLGVDLHEIEMGPRVLQELPAMITHLDEPTADPAALNQMLISRLANQQGIKVLLSGAGGDDLFSGYRRHLALSAEKYWAPLPRSWRKLAKRGAGLFPQDRGWGRRAAKAMRYMDWNEEERLLSYFYWTTPEQVRTLLHPDLYPRDFSPNTFFLNELSRLPARTAPLQRMLYLEQKHFLADHNLNYGDKMSMRHHVEVRVPFLDPDLMRFSWQLPMSLKQHGSQGKYIFKKAMAKYLPPTIIGRPKTGFSLPLRSWMHQELKPMQNDLLSSASLQKRGLFSPTMVAQLREQDSQGKSDSSYTIFALICMELWCRIFLDGRSQL